MNRLLKFRVWDKGLRAFIPLTDLSQLTDPRFVVCQFTGVCDANGTELYEGDITRYVCQYERGPVEGAYLYLVDFENGGFGVRSVDGTDFIPFENLSSGDVLMGNRLEHPYLLKGL